VAAFINNLNDRSMLAHLPNGTPGLSPGLCDGLDGAGDIFIKNMGIPQRALNIGMILDKWDLKEGHDAIAFMEQMVSDVTVKKVIVILDRVYAEKADGRQGGVGTETQIITPQIYKSVDQNKFVGVISEVDADRKSPWARCDHRRFAACSSIAATTNARTGFP
jgi:SEFIR domain